MTRMTRAANGDVILEVRSQGAFDHVETVRKFNLSEHFRQVVRDEIVRSSEAETEQRDPEQSKP